MWVSTHRVPLTEFHRQCVVSRKHLQTPWHIFNTNKTLSPSSIRHEVVKRRCWMPPPPLFGDLPWRRIWIGKSEFGNHRFILRLKGEMLPLSVCVYVCVCRVGLWGCKALVCVEQTAGGWIISRLNKLNEMWWCVSIFCEHNWMCKCVCSISV